MQNLRQELSTLYEVFYKHFVIRVTIDVKRETIAKLTLSIEDLFLKNVIFDKNGSIILYNLAGISNTMKWARAFYIH